MLLYLFWRYTLLQIPIICHIKQRPWHLAYERHLTVRVLLIINVLCNCYVPVWFSDHANTVLKILLEVTLHLNTACRFTRWFITWFNVENLFPDAKSICLIFCIQVPNVRSHPALLVFKQRFSLFRLSIQSIIHYFVEVFHGFKTHMSFKLRRHSDKRFKSRTPLSCLFEAICSACVA